MKKTSITFMLLLPVLALLLLQPVVASAQEDPCSGATFNIDPTSGLAGSMVTASGTGIATWAPDYDIYWDSVAGTLLASDTANASGDFSTSVTVPADATVGDHLMILVATAPNEAPIECPQTFTVTQPTVEENAYTGVVTVTPETTTLPSTGAFLLPAAGLLVAGAALVARRRRQ